MKHQSKRAVRSIAVMIPTVALLALVVARGGQSRATAPGVDLLERGAYLVMVGGCNDCHTPWKMGDNGPEPDMTRMLSGHPAEFPLPPAPALDPGPWIGSMVATNTAFAGPWGVSFAANLTPDELTGLGAWNEEIFMNALRTGRHWGQSRPLLPPMPWFNYGRMTDEDLRAVFTYLRSIPARRNAVPLPIPPGGQDVAANDGWD